MPGTELNVEMEMRAGNFVPKDFGYLWSFKCAEFLYLISVYIEINDNVQGKRGFPSEVKLL